MSSIWTEMTGIRSHSVEEITDAVSKAVAETDMQMGKGAVAAQLEEVAQASDPERENGHGLADVVATMDAPSPGGIGSMAAPEAEAQDAMDGPEAEDEGPEVEM